MKETKFSWLFCLMTLLSLSFVLTSCDKDDDVENSNSIVGIWQSCHYYFTKNGVKDTEYENFLEDEIFQFNSDGTFLHLIQENNVWYGQKFTYHINGEEATIFVNGRSFTSKFSKSGFYLTIVDETIEGNFTYLGYTEYKKIDSLPGYTISSSVLTFDINDND
ncbi:MAG: hypothetical protein MJZ61_08515 [Bacteroidales bacterium]|nr:hypothetical protein [Bacteroidales bacterium]